MVGRKVHDPTTFTQQLKKKSSSLASARLFLTSLSLVFLFIFVQSDHTRLENRIGTLFVVYHLVITSHQAENYLSVLVFRTIPCESYAHPITLIVLWVHSARLGILYHLTNDLGSLLVRLQQLLTFLALLLDTIVLVEQLFE